MLPHDRNFEWQCKSIALQKNPSPVADWCSLTSRQSPVAIRYLPFAIYHSLFANRRSPPFFGSAGASPSHFPLSLVPCPLPHSKFGRANLPVSLKLRYWKAHLLMCRKFSVGQEPDPPNCSRCAEIFSAVQEHCPPKNHSLFATRHSPPFSARQEPRSPILLPSLVPRPSSR